MSILIANYVSLAIYDRGNLGDFEQSLPVAIFTPAKRDFINEFKKAWWKAVAIMEEAMGPIRATEDEIRRREGTSETQSRT